MPTPARGVHAPDLYCITDCSLCPLPLEEQVQEMVGAGARLVQLRAKPCGDARLRLAAQNCATICRWAGALFIVNDHVEIAATVGADGLHLGQGDMPVEQARRILGEDFIIGLSTHNRLQFEAALDLPVNYIALGPVFGTTTKANADPAVGLAYVSEAARRLQDDHRPLVLIGGITLENLPLVRQAAPNALVCSIGGILRVPPIGERVREFRRALGHR